MSPETADHEFRNLLVWKASVKLIKNLNTKTNHETESTMKLNTCTIPFISLRSLSEEMKENSSEEEICLTKPSVRCCIRTEAASPRGKYPCLWEGGLELDLL